MTVYVLDCITYHHGQVGVQKNKKRKTKKGGTWRTQHSVTGDQVDHSTTRNEVVPVATMVLDSPRGVVSRVVEVW